MSDEHRRSGFINTVLDLLIGKYILFYKANLKRGLIWFYSRLIGGVFRAKYTSVVRGFENKSLCRHNIDTQVLCFTNGAKMITPCLN